MKERKKWKGTKKWKESLGSWIRCNLTLVAIKERKVTRVGKDVIKKKTLTHSYWECGFLQPFWHCGKQSSGLSISKKQKLLYDTAILVLDM